MSDNRIGPKVRPVDPRQFQDLPRESGRPRKIIAANAREVFRLINVERDAQARIRKLLLDAGYKSKDAQARMRRVITASRGEVSRASVDLGSDS